MKNVGIDAIDYYIPNLFVDMQDLSLARDIPYEKLSQGLGLKKMSIPDSNEDTASLAANALLNLITKNKINYVCEIASNDGTLLKEYKNVGYEILGVDPAKNISNKANKNNIKIT